MIKLKELQVENLGTVVYCDNHAFDTAVQSVMTESHELLSMRDMAYVRIFEAKNSVDWKYGGWENSIIGTFCSNIKEGSLFVPRSKDKIILLRDSLVLKNPSGALNAHRIDKSYFPKGLRIEEYLENLDKKDYFVLSNISKIATNRFNVEESMIWMFQDLAGEYGLLLQDTGVYNVNFWLNHYDTARIDYESKPFANQIQIHGLGDLPPLYIIVDGDLNDRSRVCGLRRA